MDVNDYGDGDGDGDSQLVRGGTGDSAEPTVMSMGFTRLAYSLRALRIITYRTLPHALLGSTSRHVTPVTGQRRPRPVPSGEGRWGATLVPSIPSWPAPLSDRDTLYELRIPRVWSTQNAARAPR